MYCMPGTHCSRSGDSAWRRDPTLVGFIGWEYLVLSDLRDFVYSCHKPRVLCVWVLRTAYRCVGM